MPRFRVTYHQRKKGNVLETEGETIAEAAARLGLPKCRWDVQRDQGGGRAVDGP